MRVLVAGGSGYLGRRLAKALIAAGDEVVVLTRRPERHRDLERTGPGLVGWRPPVVDAALMEAVAWADGVVNLSGAVIGGRPWTAGRRRVIRESRTVATTTLVEAIGAVPAAARPAVLVNASGADYYGDRPAERCTEATSPGESFLASVCVDWEAAALAAEAHGVRVVVARCGFIVGAGAFAFRLLALPTRLFLGGRLGRGDQSFAWVGIDDAVGLYELALRDEAIRGPLNVVGPVALPQTEVATTLGRLLHRPSRLPLPAALLRLVLRGQADLFLHGHEVVPERAIAAGYAFRTPTFGEAAALALGRLPTAPG